MVSFWKLARETTHRHRFGHLFGYDIDRDESSTDAGMTEYGPLRDICTGFPRDMKRTGRPLPNKEEGVFKEIKPEDFDEASFIDGCIDGYKDAPGSASKRRASPSIRYGTHSSMAVAPIAA